MEDKNLLEQLWREVQQVEIPPELEPEQIQKRLCRQEAAQTKQKPQRLRRQKRHFRWHGAGSRVAAASIVFAVSLATFALAEQQGQLQQGEPLPQEVSGQTDLWQLEAQQEEADGAEILEKEEKTGQETRPSVKMLGEYHQAESYEELTEMAAQLNTEQTKNFIENLADGAVLDVDSGLREEAAENDTLGASSSASVAEDAVAEKADFSTTNLQVQGVDESDIIKTDGQYLYIAAEDQVRIVDTFGGRVRQLGSLTPKLSGNLDRICEMYVAQERLILVIQAQQTEAFADSASTAERVADIWCGSSENLYTQVLTFDISIPASAKLIGTYVQDGAYQTSRKIGDQLYLFTDYWMDTQMSVADTDDTSYVDADGYRKERAVDGNAVCLEDAASSAQEQPELGLLPKVQGKVVPTDCIYLPKQACRSGVYVTSLNVTEPEQVCDQKLIFSGNAKLYVTEQTILLYYTRMEQRGGQLCTKLVKFVIADGQIAADCAEAVNGEILDTFAVHENRAGEFYVLTTDQTASGSTNQLFVLDETLKIKGKITHIADGETVYAARFVDEIGYFVTYRNTDPLFTVDLTDPTAPTLIGTLELPGFSDYLQFWDDTHLIGVGEERNADSEFLGMKLSLYDISDPTDVKECAKAVLSDAYASPAAYNYKALLADSKKNVIAFLTNDKGTENRITQHIFRVKDGALHEQTADCVYEREDWARAADNYRSLYIDERLYLVCEEEIIVYDMTDDFARVGVYELR